MVTQRTTLVTMATPYTPSLRTTVKASLSSSTNPIWSTASECSYGTRTIGQSHINILTLKPTLLTLSRNILYHSSSTLIPLQILLILHSSISGLLSLGDGGGQE